MKNRTLTILLALCLTPTICLAEDWPQWRGPRYDGVSRESGLPTEWSDSSNVVWKVQLPGIGSATPVVSGNRISLTSQAGKEYFSERFHPQTYRASPVIADGKLILTGDLGRKTPRLGAAWHFVVIDASGRREDLCAESGCLRPGVLVPADSPARPPPGRPGLASEIRLVTPFRSVLTNASRGNRHLTKKRRTACPLPKNLCGKRVALKPCVML